MEMKEDRPAWVQFEVRSMERRNEAGESVNIDVDFAIITPPYSRDSVELVATEWLSQCDLDVKGGRLPPVWRDQWKQAYKSWKEGQEAPVDGTSLKNWSMLSPAQLKNLLHMGMRSVEDVAGMNDEGLRRYGIGGLDLKNKAAAFLKAQTGPAKVASENAALKVKVDQQEKTIESMGEKLAELEKALSVKRAA